MGGLPRGDGPQGAGPGLSCSGVDRREAGGAFLGGSFAHMFPLGLLATEPSPGTALGHFPLFLRIFKVVSSTFGGVNAPFVQTPRFTAWPEPP